MEAAQIGRKIMLPPTFAFALQTVFLGGSDVEAANENSNLGESNRNRAAYVDGRNCRPNSTKKVSSYNIANLSV